MRADARRNRDQIVDAARLLFISGGPDVPMDEIARAAGVGVGTLYRRFPDRAALFDAVSVTVFERLAEMLRAARAEESDAWRVLVRFLHDWAKFRLGLLHDTLCSRLPEANEEIRALRETWLELFEQAVRDAHQAGALRPDVDLADIATFMNLLVQSRGPADNDRLLDLMLDGMRVRPGT